MKNYKKMFATFLTLVLVTLVLLTGCTPADVSQGEASEPLLISLLVNGTLGDKSFYDSANNGMRLLKEKYGDAVEIKVVEATYDRTKWQPALQDLSDSDADIIICGSFEMKEIVEEVAIQYPEKKYILFDTDVDYEAGGYENVYSMLYKQNEASFLAGIVAAKTTSSDLDNINGNRQISFIGGMDIPVINDFLVGYIKGIQYADPEVHLAISYVNDFSDAAKAKELALAQIAQGADIVYAVAGQAGLGAIEAAKEQKAYAIGVDSDQAALFAESDLAKSASIITSVIKSIDISLVRAIDKYMEGILPFGETEVLGLKEECVEIVKNDNYETYITKEIQNQIDDVTQKIISGEIVVTSAFGMETAELDALRDSIK